MKKLIKKKAHTVKLREGDNHFQVHPDGKIKQVAPTDPAHLYAELMTMPARYFTVNEIAYLIRDGAAIDSIRLTELLKNANARKDKLTKKV